ncbi:MAG: hypothetical protein KTR21_10965 [Rhodobacteraceae bacterium]|nr:hypothetical protein [Paracoccaceae bacterium]
MGLFLSTSIHKIDKKGRVSVPALFRAALEQESFRGVALAPPLGELACVEGSGLSRIERIAASLDKMNPLEEQHAALATAIMARVRPIPFDGEGRIILPEEFVALAELDGQALFAGLGANFQIWSPTNFEAHQTEALKVARASASALPWNTGDGSTNSG